MITRNLNLSSLLTSMAVLAGLVAVMAGALGALGFWAKEIPGQGEIFDPYLWRVLRFTLWQAGLSAVLSVGLAIPVARAISRRQSFTGRTFLLRLFALPLALPALVVVLGIVEVWGRHGWIADALESLGFDVKMPSIYGLGGILLAHVFFNLPLAVRLMVLHFAKQSRPLLQYS